MTPDPRLMFEPSPETRKSLTEIRERIAEEMRAARLHRQDGIEADALRVWKATHGRTKPRALEPEEIGYAGPEPVAREVGPHNHRPLDWCRPSCPGFTAPLEA